MVKKSRLRWFGHVERKDDDVGNLKELHREDTQKTWWDCVKDDMESLGLSEKEAQFRNVAKEN